MELGRIRLCLAYSQDYCHNMQTCCRQARLAPWKHIRPHSGIDQLPGRNNGLKDSSILFLGYGAIFRGGFGTVKQPRNHYSFKVFL